MKRILLILMLSFGLVSAESKFDLEKFGEYVKNVKEAYYSENIFDTNLPKWEIKLDGFKKYNLDLEIKKGDVRFRTVHSMRSEDGKFIYARLVSLGEKPTASIVNELLNKDSYRYIMHIQSGHSYYVVLKLMVYVSAYAEDGTLIPARYIDPDIQK